MCEDGSTSHHEPSGDPALDPVLSKKAGLSRRNVLRAGGVAAVAAATRSLWVPGSAWGASPKTLTGLKPVRNAMHVHGSWSEGPGSWESQYAQAAAFGTDVMWMTDHDFRALAYRYLDSLNGVAMVATQSGTLAQGVATIEAGVTRVVAESARASSLASMSYATPVVPTAVNKLRVSIAGQRLTVKFPACRIDRGGTYEVVIQLSNHPAFGTRPAGQFELRYRFGSFGAARFVEPNGLTGIVTAPTPLPGASVVLNPTADVTALWPDMLAIDNSMYLLTLVATSPAKGTVVDVSASVAFARTQNNAADLVVNQQTVINTYGPRYPGLSVYPTSEISYLDPHIIPFGVPQLWPDQAPILATESSAYNRIAQSVHAQGGLVSYNHPFGATQGALLPLAQQAALRRQTFAAMMKDGRMGADILEVGYATRGSCGIQTFIDLWDTFSRNGVFMTGNGVTDNHDGLRWNVENGFTTGVWAISPSQVDLVAALAAGRAYTYHASHWPNGQLDLLVGGRVRMGKVEVTLRTSRALEIYAANLPKGSTVEVVQGPVDYAGNDPATKVVASLGAALFGASATASIRFDTTHSTFVRVQVRNSAGVVIGVSNPVWTLKTKPLMGVPSARHP
jgi:hypothetical protein